MTTITMTGVQAELLARATVETFLPAAEPLSLEIHGEERSVSSTWLVDALKERPMDFDASWNVESEDHVYSWFRGCSLVMRDALFDDLMGLARRMAELPFELATISTPFWDEWEEQEHIGGGFGDGHLPWGWACMFKGRGHEMLCSRRFLDYGPWKKHVLPDDVTLLQFYDVDADAETARLQAEPGQERLRKGYLYDRYTDFDGVYDASTRILKIPVAGRELTQDEMRDACKLQREMKDHPETPMDAVGFTFPIPGEHEPYLFDLWVRELHCYAFVDHEERRVDQDYVPPPPEPPAWAR
jgi:hypothetical protein